MRSRRDDRSGPGLTVPQPIPLRMTSSSISCNLPKDPFLIFIFIFLKWEGKKERWKGQKRRTESRNGYAATGWFARLHVHVPGAELDLRVAL